MIGIAVLLDLDMARDEAGDQLAQGLDLVDVLRRSDIEFITVHLVSVRRQHNFVTLAIVFVDIETVDISIHRSWLG